jgi:hypothetical protein
VGANSWCQDCKVNLSLLLGTPLASAAWTSLEVDAAKLGQYSLAVSTTSVAAVVGGVHDATSFGSANLVTDCLASGCATCGLPRALLDISTDLAHYLAILGWTPTLGALRETSGRGRYRLLRAFCTNNQCSTPDLPDDAGNNESHCTGTSEVICTVQVKHARR